jgi:predicted nuclease of predicted toxin-antitoxin system
VKFLIDAQLPRRLARLLESLGHEALHTLELPEKNRTADETLCRLALDGNRIVVTKDTDFVDSFLVRGLPPKLLFVATGNISNDELLALFRGNLPAITAALEIHTFVEIDRTGINVRL